MGQEETTFKLLCYIPEPDADIRHMIFHSPHNRRPSMAEAARTMIVMDSGISRFQLRAGVLIRSNDHILARTTAVKTIPKDQRSLRLSSLP
ncbi:hypothetical protein ACK83U_26120 (plasmid) [Rhizobium sp. WW22]|uniref:hypothetical protein n=1 Tax=unclassified Rhizobium TaxID=2613769 RepID=UPI001839BE48|nr:hypothetical protein [Rhizobium sp. BK098]MBB3615836.1 hypothetical protein [Rhizobium sp. BK609]MBB3681495.1 hypothetical protein [Rhizobium sp. BK612]